MSEAGERAPMTPEQYESYKPLVEEAAGVIAKRSPHYEADDLEQDLWVWLLEDGHGYIARAQTRGEINVGALMVKMAKRFSMKELADYREFQGDYTYTPADVRTILEDGLTEGGDIEGRLDVTEAMKGLKRRSRAQHDAILKRYTTEEKLTSTERSNILRGVDMLVDILNKSTADQRERVGMDVVAQMAA